jgi:hypothetical protein
MPQITNETLNAIQTRLQELIEDATPEQIAYLAKALESIAGKTTAFDIAQLTDEKLEELAALTQTHLDQLNTAKMEAELDLNAQKETIEAELNAQKLSALSEMEADILQNLSLLDTRKNEHLAQIADAVNDLVTQASEEMATFNEINDLPEGTTLSQELQKRSLIEQNALPFVFGVLSRGEDNYGLGGFTTALGIWTDVANANTIMSLLTGCHSYDTSYTAFFRPPQLCFFQGNNGVFMHKHLNTTYAYSSSQYYYPHAALGVVFVKNTTNAAITKTLSFGGSVGGSSSYGGMAVFVGTPNEENTAITWVKPYSSSSTASNTSSTASVTVPANTTVAVLLYTSGYYVSTSNSHYSTFLHWYLYNMKSAFLTNGLEIDKEKTLKAWQCPGYSDPIELWQNAEVEESTEQPE